MSALASLSEATASGRSAVVSRPHIGPGRQRPMVDVPLDPKRSSAPIKHNQNSTHRRGMSTRPCAIRGLNMTNAKKLRTHLLTGIASTFLLAGAATPVYAPIAPPEGEQAPGPLDATTHTAPRGGPG